MTPPVEFVMLEIVRAFAPVHAMHVELAPITTIRMKTGAASGPLKLVCPCGKTIKISRNQQALYVAHKLRMVERLSRLQGSVIRWAPAGARGGRL